MLVPLFFQFDEEFSARQEAQAESQKKEEKIKELEGKIQALESQVKSVKRNPTTLQNSVTFPQKSFHIVRFPKKKAADQTCQEGLLISF